jgi:alpha-mannosidase
LIFDTPDGFFEQASASGLPFPTVHDELQHHAVGCYSAHSGVKRLNRRAENALISAEKFCAIAQQVTGQQFPEEFERAWKAVLFNQFHDILAGTSLEAAYEDARDGYGEAMSIGWTQPQLRTPVHLLEHRHGAGWHDTHRGLQPALLAEPCQRGAGVR